MPNVNILIVDDVPDNLHLLSKALTEQGYEVRGVVNGAMAIKVTRSAPPDLILLDIKLPDISGYEVCEILKADVSTQDLPIIFLSALDEALDKVRAFAVGGVDYITKPFQIAEVIARIENQLALQRAKAEIHRLNTALEARVQERTIELQQANFELEREIAVRQQAENQLKRVLQQLTFHVENTPLAVIEWNREVRLHRWSHQAENLFGWTAEDVLGQVWFNCLLVDEADRDQVHQTVTHLLEGTESRNMCCIHNHTKQGALLECEWYNSALLDDTGQLVSILSLVLDVSDRKRAEKALRDSEERFRLITENMSDLVCLHAVDGQYRYVSPSCQHLLGFQPQELIGTSPYSLFHPDDRQRVRQESHQPTLEGNRTLVNYRIRNRSGQYLWFESITKPICDATGNVVSLLTTSRDVSDKVMALEALRKSEEQFRLTFELAPIGMAIVSLSGQFLKVNRALCHTLGYAAEELLHQPWTQVMMPEDAKMVAGKVKRLSQGLVSHIQLEIRYLAKTGTTLHTVLGVSLTRDSKDQPLQFIAQILDITDRKRAEDQLMHDALHDALTGLPNRALFMERVEAAVRRAKRHPNYQFAVLFIDLDRFKVVNDSLGHLVGDQLLVAIAYLLQHCLRSIDTVARLGGDEFTILLDEVQDIKDVTKVAKRIQAELASPVLLMNHAVFTSASIGIVLSSAEYQQGLELLRDADIAMYRAKEKGRARYEVFDRVMHAEALRLLQLESDLRQALERQEFVLHYQPIVALPTNKLIGFEALIRWQHPQQGLVSPTEFIPVAEENGLIVAIGEWVMQEACRQLRDWQQQFPTVAYRLKMSINLSGKQLKEPSLLERIDHILAVTSLEGDAINLELTESILVENPDKVSELLLTLKTRGIQLSIDDFGTGFSSLSYLHQFPINTLKIDRSFVKNMGFGYEKLGLVRSIIALAHTLDMDVVAEGIEHEMQLNQLKSLGCEFGQGYWFSRPLDVNSATALIQSWAMSMQDRNGG